MLQNSLFIVSQGNTFFCRDSWSFHFAPCAVLQLSISSLESFLCFSPFFPKSPEGLPSWCSKLIHFVLFVPLKIARPRLLHPAINLTLPLSRLRSRVTQQIAPIYVHHPQCKVVVSVGEDDIIQLCLLCFPSSRGLSVVLLTLAELRSFI